MLTRSLIFTLILSLTVASCNRPSANPNRGHPERLDIPQDEWVGIYASPREISRFSGTVLGIEKSLMDRLSYRMIHYTDRQFANDIEQAELHGSCLTVGSSIFIPTASGYYDDDRKPQLSAAIERYTLVTIKERQVLMRDDALRAYRENNKLYDYGILIRTDDAPNLLLDLRTVERPSIKLLYDDPSKPWHDPYVHGPNAR